jgi:oxygen-independent coproporphyrinogen-3 oxidase
VSNSVEKSFTLIEPFTEALLNEIKEAAKVIHEHGLRVISVYIGGGTPTSLPDANLEMIMRAVDGSFDLSAVREYTVEAGRPDTITRGKLEIIKTMGAGRVCVNPQSMSAEVLSAIGRKHTPEHVIDAVNEVRRIGFTLNMDVIAGLPGDNPDGFALTLDTVLGSGPENVTVHTLSMKKGSRLMLDGTEKPDGASVARMLGYASDKLRGNNYTPYYLYRQKFTSGGFENTGWSLPGFECIYNVCMMEELCTVVSLGGGGVTKLVSPGGRIERIFNAKYPREYIMHSDKVKDKFRRIREIVSFQV